MINKLRLILFPFSLLYALVTEIRNLLYDKNILHSTAFEIPVINVGNLSMGGTGKTPMIEYLIRLLQKDYKIAVVSRGYKRKTKGFIVADEESTPEQIGDEPYQIHQKFERVIVAVGEKRADAVRKVSVKFQPDIILLDDAYQHRKLRAGFNILLSNYHRLFTQDYVLPAGNLRECRKNAKRADIVIISKSPANLNPKNQQQIQAQIQKYTAAPVFFSQIEYGGEILSKQQRLPLKKWKEYQVLLITGIAHPEPLLQYLSEKSINFDVLKFGDHHRFTLAEIQQIKKKFTNINHSEKLILTTEKDFVRLQKHFDKELFYLPIQTKITDKEKFNHKILDYVQK